MGRERRVLLVGAACVSLAIAAPLLAQQSPSDDPALIALADAQRRAAQATEWLRSEDPLRVAWGAWLARQDRQTALVPLLLGKVEEYQPTGLSSFQTGESDRHDALLMVLDALIGLGAPVPPAQARKLYPEFAAQSLILLVRSHDDAQAELFDIFQIARANWDWLAAGNVLFKTRPPGFAALLLGRFTQHLLVSVYDPGQGGGFGGGGSECGFSLRAPKAGWPPVGLYLLTQFPGRITWLPATFLVDGETPVSYWRAEPGNYDNPPDVPGYCDEGNRDRYRAQYLNKLMEFLTRTRLDPYPQVRIEWKDADRYRQQLMAAVEEQRAAFLRAAQALTPDEAGRLRPRLEMVIRDERADPSVALPAVLGNDADVAVRTELTRPLY
jgi:hypothetical protein